MLEESLTVEILVLRVLQPPRDQGLEELLIDWPRKLCQLVADLSHVSQARTQEIIQLWAAGLGLHNAIRNCRVSAPKLPIPQHRYTKPHGLKSIFYDVIILDFLTLKAQ